MLSFDALTARRAEIDESPDLSMLRDRLVARAAPVLERMPVVPQVKALLSRDGGVCPDDQSQLVFDPWSPDAHRCPTCGRNVTGERHAAHWARAQHLWIAERAAHLATLHAVTGDESAARRAREMLAAYYGCTSSCRTATMSSARPICSFPRTSNRSGSWIILAAAFMLREMHALDDDDVAQHRRDCERGRHDHRRVQRGFVEPANLEQRSAHCDRDLVWG